MNNIKVDVQCPFVGIAQLAILDQLLKNGFAMNVRCHSF